MRMGLDKALLKAGNETIIERLTGLMKSIFSQVFIVTNTPVNYKFLNVPVHEDVLKYKGPLSGIHSGLIHSSTDKNFFLSCDLPLITKELIEYIVEYESEKSVRFCIAGKHHHYLAGMYSKSLIPEIEKIINVNPERPGKKEQKFSIKNLLSKTQAEIINAENLPFYNKNLFFNLNTKEDFELLKKILSTR